MRNFALCENTLIFTVPAAHFAKDAWIDMHNPTGAKCKSVDECQGSLVTDSGRAIDLSRAAAEQIGMIRRGHARVEMELVE